MNTFLPPRFVGTSAPKLGPKAAAVLLLDGTLTLSRSLATLLNLDSSGAQTAAADGGGANDDRTGATLVSCAAAVTCGGPGEPSTLDGTANVSRLVPYAAADSNGLQQIQFAAR